MVPSQHASSVYTSKKGSGFTHFESYIQSVTGQRTVASVIRNHRLRIIMLLQPLVPHSGHIARVAPFQVQNLALVKLHIVKISLPLMESTTSPNLVS